MLSKAADSTPTQRSEKDLEGVKRSPPFAHYLPERAHLSDFTQ